MKDLVIVGVGGHGRELFDTVEVLNAVEPTWNVIGFVDDAPTHFDRVERLGSVVLGDIGWLVENPTPFVLGIGTPALRRSVLARLGPAASGAVSVVDPRASIGGDTRIGDGVVVFDRSVVTTNVTIGDHTQLNVGCTVQHDSVVGDFVQFSPGVFVNGDCHIGDDVFLGTGAIVTRGCSIGDGARIGAGAVVLHDVPAASTAIGIPAVCSTMRSTS